MLYGTVDYELKDGKSANVEWAARAHFTNAEGDLKMDFYQVYLVGSILPSAAMSSTNSPRRIQQPCLVLSRLMVAFPDARSTQSPKAVTST